MKVKLALLAMSVAGMANAANVNTIIDLNHIDSGDFDATTFEALHYFDGRELRGPLDQFSFINSNSFISGFHRNTNTTDTTNVSAQWYGDSGFFVGAGYAQSRLDIDADFGGDDSRDIYNGTLGYQANEVWSVSATFFDAENSNSLTVFDISYEHDLGQNDWVAFSYNTDDELDFHTLTTRYFNTLDNGGYLVLTADVTEVDEGSGDWNVGAEYYWNNYTSVFASVGDDDTYQVGAQHYFNDTWALTASYADSDLLPDSTWAVNLRAQF